jgi:hypothetical protein
MESEFIGPNVDTDLDVAYSILFEEANNEYIKERERAEEGREDKNQIPFRVFRSFLDSVENDVIHYVGEWAALLVSPMW